jgi:hypothetical protein
MTAVRIHSEHDRYDEKSVTVYETEIPNQEARFGMEIISRWAMVAAKDAGEDSAGRHRVQLATEQEVVNRAFTIANLAFTHMRAMGLLVKVPDINEVNAERDAKKTAKNAKEKEVI